jgi:Heterokaryon incompatibility protein (HET)
MEIHYIYPPLGSSSSIRVLELMPAKTRNARLRCLLREEVVRIHELGLGGSVDENGALSSGNDYDALSYAWESQIPDRSIIMRCEGGGEQIRRITFNVEAALRRPRLRTESRRLWVDSICIDQSSIAERNHQVSLMGDIYWSAQRVFIWLGESNEDAINTISFLKGFVRNKPQSDKFLEAKRKRIMMGTAGEEQRCIPPIFLILVFY